MNPEIDIYPSNIDIEYSLIGWILIDNSVMGHIAFLEPADFYSAPHADIFAAMQEIYAKGEQITPFTIHPYLSSIRNESFKDANGLPQYLSGALAACRLDPWPDKMAKYIKELSTKRRLVIACEGVINSAVSKNDPITSREYASGLSRVLDSIASKSNLFDMQDDYDIGQEILKDMLDERKPDLTGMPRLNNAMDGGLYPGKSYGFAAKKKMGKTTLAGTISVNLATQNIKHLFICGEMSPKEIHQRNLARLTDSFPSAFRNSYGESSEFQYKIARVIKDSNRCILFRNAPGLTFDELKRICTSAADSQSIKGFILDYWQLVGGKQKNQSTAEHLDEVSQWIADFCRKRGIWSITMAQINQEGNTRGGEGMRLAFDQVYQLRSPADDPSRTGRYLQMMDTRYTKWGDIGDENSPGYLINEKGPYFEEQLK